MKTCAQILKKDIAIKIQILGIAKKESVYIIAVGSLTVANNNCRKKVIRSTQYLKFSRSAKEIFRSLSFVDKNITDSRRAKYSQTPSRASSQISQ